MWTWAWSPGRCSGLRRPLDWYTPASDTDKKNLKVSARLTLLIGVLSLLLASIGLLGLYGISQSNAALKTVQKDRTVALGPLGQIDMLTLASRLALNVAMDEPASEAPSQRAA